MFDFDPVRDQPNVRIYDLGNNKLKLTRTDPYGFIVISYDKGQIPETLRGNYTSFSEAEQAVQKYLKDKGKEPVSTK